MNVQKLLRNVHKTHERQETEKRQVRNEVSRLTKIVSTGSSKSEIARSGSQATVPIQQLSLDRTVEERKKQIAKLVEMGVTVPEEFRADMALAGDWLEVSEKQSTQVKKPKLNPNTLPNTLKRKQEDEEISGQSPQCRDTEKNWGSAIKRFPLSDHYEDNPETLMSSKLEGVGRDMQIKIENDDKDMQEGGKATGQCAADKYYAHHEDKSIVFKKRRPKPATHSS